MMNPVEAVVILIGTAFCIGVCGAALAIGVSVALSWWPLTIKINTFHHKIEP